jgi:hypothetical protein
VGGTSLTFSQTDQRGIYTVTPVIPAAASASAAGTASPAASGSATPAADPTTPFRFAVDLFDVAESNIAPGKSSTIEALGRAAANAGAGGAVAERPVARDELWVPILLIALAALCVEWAVYHRDALVRGWRSIVARRRGAADRP